MIVCCYAPGHLKPETREALLASRIPVEFRPVQGEYGYWEAMVEMFARGETFINVEHDIVPSAEALHSLLDCRNPLCYAPYTYLKEDRWWQLWRSFCDRGEQGDVRGACQELTDAIWAVHCQGLGCVKFGAKLLRERREAFASIPRTPWKVLDGAIYNALGWLEACQHDYHVKHVDHIDWSMTDQTVTARPDWTIVHA